MCTTARDTVDTLEALGITHVTGLPDNMSAPLFAALERSSIRVVTVTREGEAFAIAAGLWIGGARPFVLIQNTGLLESGDALRGTVTRMGVPLVILVTWRGYASLSRANGGADGETLVRPDVDSVALMTEPTLDAWGIPVVSTADGLLEAIERGIADADRMDRPVAVLMSEGVSG